jgi:hypothetical protein
MVMTLHNYIDYFSVDGEGNLTFTALGLTEHRRYFGQAGIDIRTVKTLDDFYRARRAASPFFNGRLAKRLAPLANTLEKRILLALANDDDPNFQRLSKLLDARDKGIRTV